MPTMPRPKGKSKEIADAIFGREKKRRSRSKMKEVVSVDTLFR